jgi:hypothetical protein
MSVPGSARHPRPAKRGRENKAEEPEIVDLVEEPGEAHMLLRPQEENFVWQLLPDNSEITFYPFANRYPANMLFSGHQDDRGFVDPPYALYAAVYFLQTARVSDLLSSPDLSDFVLVHGFPGKPKYNLLQRLCYGSYRDASRLHYPYHFNRARSKLMLNLLLCHKGFRVFLTPELFRATFNEGGARWEVLCEHEDKVEAASGKDPCYVCACYFPDVFLPPKGVCECQTPLHLHCFQRVLRTSQRSENIPFCPTCHRHYSFDRVSRRDFLAGEDANSDTVFFPRAGIYRDGCTLVIYSKRAERMLLAIACAEPDVLQAEYQACCAADLKEFVEMAQSPKYKDLWDENYHLRPPRGLEEHFRVGFVAQVNALYLSARLNFQTIHVWPVRPAVVVDEQI